MRLLSAKSSHKLLRFLQRRIGNRPADFIIGGRDNPYMHRWWMIPRNRFFNIYLHHIVRDDDDRALHDHPWTSLSLILSGGYFEVTGGGRHYREPGRVTVRRASTPHRLELEKCDLMPGPPVASSCWSLFITGPRIREWGFLCPKGWVHWQDFVASDPGQVGAGCEGPVTSRGKKRGDQS